MYLNPRFISIFGRQFIFNIGTLYLGKEMACHGDANSRYNLLMKTAVQRHESKYIMVQFGSIDLFIHVVGELY